MNKFREFFHGVQKEAARIHWPKGKVLLKYSVICIILIVFFGLFFFGLDAIFAWLKGVIS